MSHPSTPAARVAWVSTLLAHEGTYGIVTAISRHSGVSRPTLYAWRERARAALAGAFGTAAVPPTNTVRSPAWAILTLLLETHASERAIQTCLEALLGWRLRLETISAVVQEAGTRALQWFAEHAPPQPCALALDELYGNDRHGAYLSAVATCGGAVWATAGPVPTDAESWTLLLWDYQERGGRWTGLVHDGGAAAAAACAAVDPAGVPRRDVWHVLHHGAKVQGRLDRQVAVDAARLATVQRYETAIAAGQHPQGRAPRTTAAAQTIVLATGTGVAADLRYLTSELRHLLGVVVVERERLLDAATRRADLAAAVALLAELRDGAPAPVRDEVARVLTHLTQARAGLLACADALDPVQRDMAGVLGEAGVALVAWAWRHRDVLGPDAATLVGGLPAAWRQPARVLIAAWAGAAHASSLAETWHSLLRPHVAVHRTLTPGLLALLAVWHNHRIFARGLHRGQSPLSLSGLTHLPPDGLTALGYAPALPAIVPIPLPPPCQEQRAA